MELNAQLNEASRHNIDPNQPDIRACSPSMHTETDLSHFDRPLKVVRRNMWDDWALFAVIIGLIILVGFTTTQRG
jgi:hypothetical protein